MTAIRIVTDSSALFIDPTVIKRYQITVVPLYVQFGSELFRLGIDIDSEAFLYRLQTSPELPTLLPPTVDDFYQVYADLNRTTTSIISLHLSSHLGKVYQAAVDASKMMLGRCDIVVIDSQTISAGLAFLVQRAAEIAISHTNLEHAVKDIRRLLPRIYSVFYVQTMQMLAQRGLISQAQTILGEMLGVMPFVTIEEGQLTIMEKALNTTQAIDKLVEFISEFTTIDEMVVLHHSATMDNTLRQLQDRLAAELGKTNFPIRLYDPIVMALLGTDATGIVILEGEEEDYY